VAVRRCEQRAGRWLTHALSYRWFGRFLLLAPRAAGGRVGQIDLNAPAELADFRRQVADFIAAQLPEGWAGEGALPRAEIAAFRARWRAALVESRFLVPHWPAAYGGLGVGPLHYAALVEEFVRAGVPHLVHENDGFGLKLVGPAVMTWGTEEQKQRFLPPTISGELRWAQGYSEPEAGSDLFSLRTRGVVQGDQVVINGQKVWTSAGLSANWMFALVRTDVSAARGRGLSFVLIDLDQPGVEVRGIKNLVGEEDYSEVFFTDARAHLGDVIGGLGNGGRVALTVLGHERGANALALAASNQIEVNRLSALANACGITAHDAAGWRLGKLVAAVELQRALATKLLAQTVAGEEIGPVSSLVKLTAALHRQQVHELAVDMLGMDANALSGDFGVEHLRPQPVGSDALSSRAWVTDYLSARAATIYGGSLQIQKNTIGEQLLGLPREPRPSGASSPSTEKAAQ
jgi:alkylation response protein AidB-like acyl-CoA dehydrogenase